MGCQECLVTYFPYSPLDVTFARMVGVGFPCQAQDSHCWSGGQCKHHGVALRGPQWLVPGASPGISDSLQGHSWWCSVPMGLYLAVLREPHSAGDGPRISFRHSLSLLDWSPNQTLLSNFIFFLVLFLGHRAQCSLLAGLRDHIGCCGSNPICHVQGECSDFCTTVWPITFFFLSLLLQCWG